MKTGILLRAGAVLCGALVLAACVSVGSKPQTDAVKLQLVVDPDINPTSDGRPSSLVLRIFQLKGDARFLAADFFDLFEKQDEILAGDLVGSQELSLVPGESRELELEISAEAQLLGVMAAYRDIRNADWRVTASAPRRGLKNLIRKDAITLHVQRAAVTLTIRE